MFLQHSLGEETGHRSPKQMRDSPGPKRGRKLGRQSLAETGEYRVKGPAAGRQRAEVPREERGR